MSNGLSPAQNERLSVVVEECAEVIQVIGKIQRHGVVTDSHNNRIALEHELGDLQWAVGLLVREDDVHQSTIDRFAAEKGPKAQPWLHHNQV